MAPYLSFYQTTSIIWAVVSDGKQVYAFKYRKDETVYKDKILVLQKCRKGRADSAAFSTGNYRSPYASDRLDQPRKIRNEVVKNFIPAVAARLEEALDGNAYDYLVIVAPRSSLNALRASLSDRVRRRLLSTMPEGYIYDKGGAIFAMRDGASVPFYADADERRDLPPCCIRSERPPVEENRAMAQ